MARKKSSPIRKMWTPGSAHGAASRFGQVIGDAFAEAVIALIKEHLSLEHPEYTLLEPEAGRQLIQLEMPGGTSRQMDNVVVPKGSSDPVALFESKWLKDARHHNDKGAWILQLREVRKKYATLRGAAAVLAGYWTEGVGVMFRSEAGIETVLVATDEEVYGTLQKPVNQFLAANQLPELPLNAEVIRTSLPRAWDLANCLEALKENGRMSLIAKQWLTFPRREFQSAPLGGDLVKAAVDKLLQPLPDTLRIERFEIALQIETGNTIYREFKDVEDAIAFIQTHFQDPKTVLDKITPRAGASH